MSDKAVEEKYKPFWHKEELEEVKIDTPVESQPVEQPKSNVGSFFDTLEGEEPRVKNRKPRKNESISISVIRTKKVVEKTESSSGGGFMNIAAGAIGISVVVAVGHMVIETIMSTPGMSQELNNTMIDGVSAESMILPGFALVAVGIIVLAAFGLLNVLRGDNNGA